MQKIGEDGMSVMLSVPQISWAVVVYSRPTNVIHTTDEFIRMTLIYFNLQLILKLLVHLTNHLKSSPLNSTLKVWILRFQHFTLCFAAKEIKYTEQEFSY